VVREARNISFAEKTVNEQEILMNELAAQFRSPGAAYRGKPFWSWNGELDEAELLRQIDVMQQMGLGGFFMHSRTGLVTEYLGEEWFRLTNVCAEEAQKRGMEAWLYDEDRWPSGTAGGMVTQDPKHRSKFMGLHTVPGAEFTWQGGLTAAFACHLNGTSFTNSVRLGPDTPASGYQTKTVLVFAVEDMEPSSFYNGETYVDTLSRAATERYIEITHEQYKARCGPHLGQSIRGIFTDEPHRGAAFTGFGLSNANRLWMTPWTEELPARFAEQFGGDIIAHLPELFLYANGEAVSPIKWQYMELLQQMFLQNFAKPLFDWCNASNMLLTGHVLHEDSLTAQAAMQGSLMRFYEYMHYPGVDVLTEGNRHFPIVKQLISAARQLGQTWLLSELYGCTGWQMDFEDHKQAGDWQALFGINLRCHHLSWYTMAGEAKRDYPASILHQSAWWKNYAYVESYFARLGLLLMQGRPCCDILVLNPVESLWCQIGVGWAEGLSPKTDALQALESAYTQLSYWLLGAHLDFDYGDEEMMGRLSRITTEADGPRFFVGEADYRVVIVGRHTTLRSSTLRLLTEFRDAGGTVIFAGEPPAFVDARPDAAALELAARALHVPWDEAALIAACRRAAPAGAEIRSGETGRVLSEISCQLRAEGRYRYLVAINMSSSQAFENARLRIDGQGQIEEWDCRSGIRYAVSARQEEGYVEFTADFPPSGERAFVLTPERDAALSARPAEFEGETERQEIAGPFAYELGEENVCVLDFARFQIGDGEWQGPLEVLEADQAVRTALDVPLRGGEMVQPWHEKKYAPAPPVLATVRLAFEFDIEHMPSEPVYFCVERPAEWRMTLGGKPLPSKPEGWWVDTAFQRIPIPSSFLNAGRNALILETDFHADINIEAVYLIGAFGVRLDGTQKTLTRLPERLKTGDLTVQGFPFYGGSVTYHLPVPAAAWAASRLSVATPAFEAACLLVHAGGGEPQMIAWQPFCAEIAPPQNNLIALEVVLTRRNTFGPLHQVPLHASGYGPGNFVTRGPDFSDDYMLYPAGLLLPPVLSWEK